MSIFGVSLFGSEHVLSENEHHFEQWINTVVLLKLVDPYTLHSAPRMAVTLSGLSYIG